MWLTGRLAPDHKTIADFCKDNGTAIRKVCARFVELCRRMGLVDARVWAKAADPMHVDNSPQTDKFGNLTLPSAQRQQ